MGKEYRISIELISGEKVQYKTTVQEKDVHNLGSRIENALMANYFGLELSGKLIMIPIQQICRVEMEPAPKMLIAHVIRNVQPVE